MSKLCRCWLPAIQLSLAHQSKYWYELQMLPLAFGVHIAGHRQSSVAFGLLRYTGRHWWTLGSMWRQQKHAQWWAEPHCLNLGDLE